MTDKKFIAIWTLFNKFADIEIDAQFAKDLLKLNKLDCPHFDKKMTDACEKIVHEAQQLADHLYANYPEVMYAIEHPNCEDVDTILANEISEYFSE